MQQFTEKVALIAGGTSGIGQIQNRAPKLVKFLFNQCPILENKPT